MTVNRHVELLLQSAEWMIEPMWGMQQLNAYLLQLSLLDGGGATYSDLGFSEMRAEAKPRYIELAARNTSEGTATTDANKISHLKLSGVMKMEDGSYTYGAKTLSSFLYYADSLSEVAGHVIEINSGGGEALAGALMHETVKSLTKPVYALVHLAASAAYLTAVAADKVYMQSEFSSLGSIGVMASLDKEMLELYRKNIMDVYADASPEKNEEFRQLVVDGKTDLYKKRLDELATVFHSKVQASRPDVSMETLKGRVYIGASAMKMGLADGYSNISAISAKLLGSSNVKEISADSTDDSGDDEEFTNNLNTTDMTLQQRFANQFMRVLGINVPGTDAGMEQAITQIEAMSSQQESIDTAVAAAVAPLQERLDDMSTRLQGALATKPADNTNLLERLAALEQGLAQANNENAELSKRVLVQANADNGGDSGEVNHYITKAEQQFGDTRQRVQG